MSYYFNKEIEASFEDTVATLTERLKQQGFGVLTTIDVKQTMKEKLGVEMGGYRILGACNPTFAHSALQAENKIGTMLPCNVIVRESGDGLVEVAAVDPVASMQAVQNPELKGIVDEVRSRLKKVVASL